MDPGMGITLNGSHYIYTERGNGSFMMSDYLPTRFESYVGDYFFTEWHIQVGISYSLQVDIEFVVGDGAMVEVYDGIQVWNKQILKYEYMYNDSKAGPDALNITETFTPWNATETPKVPRTTAKVLKTTANVLKTTAKVLKTTAKVLKTTAKVLKTTAKVLKTTAKVPNTTTNIPNTTEKVSNTETRVPNTTTEMPNTIIKATETEPQVDHYSLSCWNYMFISTVIFILDISINLFHNIQ